MSTNVIHNENKETGNRRLVVVKYEVRDGVRMMSFFVICYSRGAVMNKKDLLSFQP